MESLSSVNIMFIFISTAQMISNFSISSNGRYVAAVMDNGNINVYSVPALSQNFTKVTGINGILIS